MNDTRPPYTFDPIIVHFTTTAQRAFNAWLDASMSVLEQSEAAIILAAVEEALKAAVRLKLNRVLLLELHAAKRAGELGEGSDESRFERFIERALSDDFAVHLDRRYPSLRIRLQRMLASQRLAMERLVARFVSDRALLASLPGQPAGRLMALALGEGDMHQGQSVAKLSLEHGKVMYKPRSLGVDRVLGNFLASVFDGRPHRIRVPQVIDRGDYGWTEFVEHAYCLGDEQLRIFYRGLGHWLAVLRLLGGTDVHLENLIAAGPVPVVIDVESLFAAIVVIRPSKHGQAYDLAQALIRGSVLRTGIVPFRAPILGFSGVDMSAAGSLQGQQPQVHVPVIVDEGTIDARMKVIGVDIAVSKNHPSPHPDVSLHWDQLSEGFIEATTELRHLDEQGELTPLLVGFEGCLVRDIRRPTQVYVEMGRMLWHPASLHDEDAAVARATDLLSRNAAVAPIAPSAPHEIASEIEDLCHGDVPLFASSLSAARIELTLADWRGMRMELENLTIKSALVATALNLRLHEPELKTGGSCAAAEPHANALEIRRRKLAADAVDQLLRFAVRGGDGSVTWISPEISNGGWQVQPLRADAYYGLGGIAVALAGYQSEAEQGRVDVLPGLRETLNGALRSLALAAGPRTVGGFTGHGSLIWTWLALHEVLQREELVERAIACAEVLEHTGFDGDQRFDLLDGASGTLVPLVDLAHITGQRRWLDLAVQAAMHLERAAIVDARGVRWPSVLAKEPIVGFAHGSTGIGWALARLTLSEAGSPADRWRWSVLADGAFRFQDSLYDASLGNWLDPRQLSREATFHTWCNGSVGVGLAACDLYARTHDPRHRRTMRRAVAASQGQWGASHTLCHGDLSLWELLVRADTLDPEYCAIYRDELTAQVVSGMEEHHGFVGGLARDAFTPGLMTGLAGAVHGLTRMHPECELGSPLLLERRLHVAPMVAPSLMPS